MASTSVIFDIIGRDRASKDFDRVGNSAQRSGGKLAKMGKLGKMAALGLAAGAGAAAVGLFKLAQGAAEDEAGQARLAKAMQNAAGASKGQVAATEDWITAQGKALGVADDDLRPALQKLVGATHDVGKAQKLASLAMDASAGTGMSLEAVSKTLMKAQNGQVAGLSKLGIKTKDAEGKTISFQEAQKRLAALHNGQASSAANTTAGKFARLKLMMGEAGETIGAKLLPIGIKLADWFLKKGVPAISAFGNYLGEKLPPIFAKVKAVVSSVMGALKGDIGGNLAGIKGIFTDAVSIIRSLWKAFGGNILQYAKAAFTNLKIVIGGAFTVIRGIFKTVSALLKGDWRGAWNGIKMILRGAVAVLKGVVRQAFNVIRFTFKNLGVAAKAIFSAMWTGIKALAKAGASALVGQIRAIPGNIKKAGGLFLSAGKALMGKLVEGLKKVGKIGVDIGKSLFNGIRSGMNSALQGLNDFLPNKIKLKGLPDIDLPDNPIPMIPGLASGGRVDTSGRIVRVAEGGEAESVLPDSMLRGMLGRAAGGGTVVHVHLNGFAIGSAAELGKHLEQALIQHNRATGRPLQVRTI